MAKFQKKILAATESADKGVPEKVSSTIQKMEVNEVAPAIEEYNGMKMNDEDKIQSMRNAIKILPPNMVKDGRHEKHNIEALCGFKVLDEMMDAAYEGITHEEF